MHKGDLITEINGVHFWYGGWNDNGWHLIYTELYNFHLDDIPTEKDCQRCYRNTYE